jgi:hypothetical protein
LGNELQRQSRKAMNHQPSIAGFRGTRYLPLGLLLIVPAYGQILPDKPGGIQGVAFTTESSQERTLVPGAQVQIQCTEAASPAIDVSTDEAGRFLAPELVPCRYRITAAAGGLEAAPLEATVQSGQITAVEIELKPAHALRLAGGRPSGTRSLIMGLRPSVRLPSRTVAICVSEPIARPRFTASTPATGLDFSSRTQVWPWGNTRADSR